MRCGTDTRDLCAKVMLLGAGIGRVRFDFPGQVSGEENFDLSRQRDVRWRDCRQSNPRRSR